MKSKQAYDIYAIKKVVQNDSTTNTWSYTSKNIHKAW
jgi:hypothetical protein